MHQDLVEAEALAAKTEGACRELLGALQDRAAKPGASPALVSCFEAAEVIVRYHALLASVIRREDANAILRDQSAKLAPFERIAENQRGRIEGDVAEALARRVDDLEAEVTLKFARVRLAAWLDCQTALASLTKGGSKKAPSEGTKA